MTTKTVRTINYTLDQNEIDTLTNAVRILHTINTTMSKLECDSIIDSNNEGLDREYITDAIDTLTVIVNSEEMA